MPKFNVKNHFLQLLTFNREGVHLNAQLSDNRKGYSVERIVGVGYGVNIRKRAV